MKPNDKQWFKDCDKMVKLLAEKLEPKDLLELHRLIFADPPGGPLSDRLSDKVIELFPDAFAELEDEEVIEVETPKGEAEFSFPEEGA